MKDKHWLEETEIFPFEVGGANPVFSVQYKLLAYRTPKEVPML